MIYEVKEYPNNNENLKEALEQYDSDGWTLVGIYFYTRINVKIIWKKAE